MTDVRKLHPRPSVSAPRPDPRPSASEPKPDAVDDARKVKRDQRTGRTSGFEAHRPHPSRPEHQRPVRGDGETREGRRNGTPDDSIGRNRGTPDDSITARMQAHRKDCDRHVGVKPQERGPVPDAAREGLDDDTLARMDRMLARTDVKGDQAAYVFTHQDFAALSAEDRTKLVGLLSKHGPRVARATAEIFQRPGASLLTQRSHDGTRLIDSLDKLASSDVHAVAGVMFDVVNPRRIWQGHAPTCTVSTMQYELASQQPAEYAKLMADLVVDGKATMRGGGELRANAATAIDAAQQNDDLRSRSEAIFQTAAMEFANGDADYRPYAQESLDGNREYRGLFPKQIRTMVGELFGAPYESLEIRTDQEAGAELGRILEREAPNRPVLFDIDMGKSNHLVSLSDVREGRVYFRDPSTGDERSMSAEKFRQKLVAVHFATPPETPAPASAMLSKYVRLLRFF
jgi:hypothetical protein